MHNEDLLDLVHLLATGDIINHLLPVSISGEAFNLGYLRFDTPVESEDRNPFESGFLDTCAKRGGRTITDDEYRTTRVGDMVGDMVFDSSGLQHTARGDDDTGFILVIERLRFVDVCNIAQGIKAKRIRVKPQGILHFFAQFIGVHSENLGCVSGHRRIHIHRYLRQSTVVIEPVEHIDDFLGTTDGERRNEQLSFAIDAGIFDHAEQFFFGHYLLLVQAVAVRRFADEIITLREEMGRRQDMTLSTTDVAGVSQALPSASRRRRMAIRIFIILIDFQRADGSAEHVAGIGEGEQHIVEETETAVVTVGNEMPHRLIDILLVVQRFHFVFLALPTRIFLNYIRKEIDIVNLKTIMKLKHEGIYGDEVMKYYIPGGMEIDTKYAQLLANYDTIKASLGDLSRLEVFEEYIKPAMEGDDITHKGILSSMKKYQADQAKKMAHMYPLSVLPIIDFMVAKETEVRNIRVVARGVDGGLGRETIKGLVVI